MGLLVTLDAHKDLQSGKPVECVEVEYQLYSWGEIYSSFIGRNHPRKILWDFPFKLYNSSVPTPYRQFLPQKLCLAFKAPSEKRGEVVWVIDEFSHETAKEFSALLSLITRRRVFAGKLTRYKGLPIEEEVDYLKSYFQRGQRPKEIKQKEIYQLLENLQVMDRKIAESFILAMRLYHSAIKIMYTEPEFSYIFLVICLEAISSVVYKDYRPENEEEFLDSKFSGWRSLLNTLPLEYRTELKKVLLKNEKFMFRKLFKFVNENLPEHFWSETEDDAKPDDLISKIVPVPDGLNQEQITHSDITIKNHEKIEKERLKRLLQNIYNARSKLIHEGIRLPESISIGLSQKVPIGAFVEIEKTPSFIRIPPLLSFERLVSYSMVEFLCKQQRDYK